jgi:putative NADPH-quinone reductase
VSSRRLLVLFAHPSLERSEINARRLAVARSCSDATVVDLYAEYPDYRIDIPVEQQRLRQHDVLMFLFPLYWYSTPALLKEWQDLVLEHGFAYGSEGRALEGKYFIAACSAGGPASAYSAEGFNHHSLRQLLLPLEQTARLCHMQPLPPFALFGARTAIEEGRLEDHLAGFRDLLQALAHEPLEPWGESDADTANGLIPGARATEVAS